MQCKQQQPTTIKQYKQNNNNQFAQRLIFDPITLAILPHPMTVLLQPCVLVSFAFFQLAFTFSHVSIGGGVAK